MSMLTLRLTKGRDARDVLTFVREDGTRTWGRLTPESGPVRDLSRYVVESTLALRNGVLGLIAGGWDVAAFEGHDAAARLPQEALWAEAVAGLLSLEATQGDMLAVDEFNAAVAESTSRARPGYRPTISAAELGDMRCALTRLRRRWDALPLCATMQLEFSPDCGLPVFDVAEFGEREVLRRVRT
ncbi:MAG TPA: hypothetical protein VNA89_02280 [Gemmatimonadaceae bacterium]|nr:hypothetical protein [Gemmatimonadaceae bacterium]